MKLFFSTVVRERQIERVVDVKMMNRPIQEKVYGAFCVYQRDRC